MTETDSAASEHEAGESTIFWKKFFHYLDTQDENFISINKDKITELANSKDAEGIQRFLLLSLGTTIASEEERDRGKKTIDFLVETGYLEIEDDTTNPFADI